MTPPRCVIWRSDDSCGVEVVATTEGVCVGGFVSLLDPEARAALLGLGRVRRYRRCHALHARRARRHRWRRPRGSGQGHPRHARRPRSRARNPRSGRPAGEWEAIEPELVSRAASNVAISPLGCRVFSADDLRRFLAVHPTAAVELVSLTIRKLRAADQRRVDATTLDASHHLAHFRVERAEARRESELDIALTQEELASLLASSRESVVRALTALRARADRNESAPDHDPRHEGLRAYAG